MPKGKYEIPANSKTHSFLYDETQSYTAYTKISIVDINGRAKNKSWFFPLPTSLDYSTNYNWSTGELGHVAVKVIDALGAGGSGAADAWNTNNGFAALSKANAAFIDGTMEGADGLGSAMGRETLRKAISSMSSLATGSDSAGKHLYRKMGVTYNPNQQLFFDGVELKDFSMSFEITPFNSAQSESFATSYKDLRTSAAPSYEEDKFYFTYPDYFDVSVVINGTTIYKRSTCVLMSTACNMAPNGQITWGPDGKPTSYNIDLSFKETDVATKDVEENNLILGA